MRGTFSEAGRAPTHMSAQHAPDPVCAHVQARPRVYAFPLAAILASARVNPLKIWPSGLEARGGRVTLASRSCATGQQTWRKNAEADMPSCPRGLSGLQPDAVDQMGDCRMGTLAFPTGAWDLSINCPPFLSLFPSCSLPSARCRKGGWSGCVPQPR